MLLERRIMVHYLLFFVPYQKAPRNQKNETAWAKWVQLFPRGNCGRYGPSKAFRGNAARKLSQNIIVGLALVIDHEPVEWRDCRLTFIVYLALLITPWAPKKPENGKEVRSNFFPFWMLAYLSFLVACLLGDSLLASAFATQVTKPKQYTDTGRQSQPCYELPKMLRSFFTKRTSL